MNSQPCEQEKVRTLDISSESQIIMHEYSEIVFTWRILINIRYELGSGSGMPRRRLIRCQGCPDGGTGYARPEPPSAEPPSPGARSRKARDILHGGWCCGSQRHPGRGRRTCANNPFSPVVPMALSEASVPCPGWARTEAGDVRW